MFGITRKIFALLVVGGIFCATLMSCTKETDRKSEDSYPELIESLLLEEIQMPGGVVKVYFTGKKREARPGFVSPLEYSGYLIFEVPGKPLSATYAVGGRYASRRYWLVNYELQNGQNGAVVESIRFYEYESLYSSQGRVKAWKYKKDPFLEIIGARVVGR